MPRRRTSATDIGDAEQCRALAELAVDRFGAVDGVVQVAAYDGLLAGLAGTGDEDWSAVLGTNVIGTMHVVSAMAEAMGDRGGSIVLIGSQSSVLPPVMEQLAYASSKGALHAAMFHLAKELRSPPHPGEHGGAHAGCGVRRCRCTCSGRSPTAASPRRRRSARSPGTCRLGEIPADEDVAESAVFLCSDRARMITGQTLYVNSGEYMT